MTILQLSQAELAKEIEGDRGSKKETDDIYFYVSIGANGYKYCPLSTSISFLLLLSTEQAELAKLKSIKQ